MRRLAIDVKTMAVHRAGISAALAAALPRLVERTPAIEWVALGPASALGRLPAAVRGIPIELMRGVGRARLPIYDQFQLRLGVRRQRASAFYSPYFDAPVGLPVPTVVTMHDAVHFRFPRLYPVAQRVYYRSLMRIHAARAAAVVTDSAFSRDEILACTGMDPRRLHVIPPALPPSFRRPAGGPDRSRLARYGLPRRYVLYPGGVEPRKNLGRLLGAYAAFRRAVPDGPALVLTGARERYANLAAEIDRHGIRASVHMPGRVEDEDMAHVYAGAECVVYPSLYEGFGLPLLEAMNAEVPIACSNRSSLPEIGGEAAWYFEPDSEESIADGLARITSDASLRERLVAAGRERAALYSVDAAAEGLARLLTDVLGRF
jgi:glycosyltransferase involved in cell wall biosynthesis